MILEILATLPILYIAKCIVSKDPVPVSGVYAVPGKWYLIKKVIVTCIYLYRKWRRKPTKDDPFRVGYGVQACSDVKAMDAPQPLHSHPRALDCIYFNGFSADGTNVFIRLGRRHGRQAEIWLFLQVPGLGEYQYPLQPDTLVYNTDGKTFKAGGLNCEVVEPMKKWRITFNGLLRKGLCNEYSTDKGTLCHVRFSFFWKAFTEVFNFDTDIPTSVICDTIAREKWSKAFFRDLKDRHQTHYEQGGELSGTLHIEGESEKIVKLRGLRDHSFGVRDWRSFHRYIVNFVWLEDGRVLHLGMVCIPGLLSHLPTGFMVTPCATTHAISWTDMELSVLGENNNPPDDYEVNFEADGRKYHMKVHAHTTAKYYHEEDWGNTVYEKLCHYDVDGVKGYGICEFAYRVSNTNPVPETKSLLMLTEPDLSPSDYASLVVGFSKLTCASSQLVGGKGCQLALLTQVKDQYGFEVTPGFCVTVTAFQQQLNQFPVLKDTIAKLMAVAKCESSFNLQSACQETVEKFTSFPLCDDVQKAIAEELIKMFKGRQSDILFAVRSSAAGEDSDEMSAAGQMATLLGVCGLNNMFNAVVKCWASLFAFQAVEYRRQKGQPIDCLMAVVIQQMVPSEASGVLFTRDPLTGNPSKMTINCNYGLGESVVSGVAEPDTVTVRRDWYDNVTVAEKRIGKKSIQMSVGESGGCQTLTVTDKDAQLCCLSDDVILKLAELGIIIEKLFSDPRDIEWAVVKDKIYLLQARPITSFDMESDEELIHEFDMPVHTDRLWLTTANIGEMMPGAVTPLTHSVFMDALEQTITGVPVLNGVVDHVPEIVSMSVGTFCNHTFICLSALALIYENNVLGNDKKVAELSILGQTLDDMSMEHVIQHTGQRSFIKRLISCVKANVVRYRSYEKTKKWEEFLKTYSIAERPTAQEQYEEITKNFPNYYQCWTDTAINTTRSGVLATVLVSTLAEGKYAWTSDHYADMAMMLSDCPDVYSAGIPTALQNLAHSISKSSDLEDFLAKTPEDAAEWLLSSKSGKAGESFSKFLQRHGHRCIREAEFREKSWNSEPSKVTKVIQRTLRLHRDLQQASKKHTSVDEALGKLKVPVTRFGKFIISKILPRARAAVGHREWGKSISIEMSDHFKTAYWLLANKMVAEGRLPDNDLLFFLTHTEIGRLLQNRSARLITRAVRRRKVLARQNEVDFPAINVGYPECINVNQEDTTFLSTGVKLCGMPVSNGVIRGTVRVVTSLELCDAIQAGDVLVVHYTDVGWTPYFPLISGLVTEMGGLLSHGAVVAREYGIPCVVNMQRATAVFKTGDQVVLNATHGTMELVENRENA